jgi:CBS domain-containing protein
MITASQLMTARPIAVRANDRVADAVEILQSLDIRHLPVVNNQHELIGVLSDRDLRGLSIPVTINAEWLGTARTALDAPVSSVMNGGPISVDLEADLAEVIDLMIDNKIGAIPVTDGDGRLAGIISYEDVLRRLQLLA